MTNQDPSLGPAGLAALIRRVAGAPPAFYRAAAGVSALDRTALTERAAVLQDQLAHLPHGTRRLAGAGHPVRVGRTGTGDSLLVLSWTANDLAREIEAGARVLGRLGIVAGMRVANTLAGAMATPGALLLGDVIEAIGALDVPLGAVENAAAARSAWELVDRVEASVLVLDPTSAGTLFAAMPAGARPWWRGIVWLRRDDLPAGDRPAAPAGFAGWQRTWLAVPDATSFVAHEGSPGRFTLDEGVYGEVVDGRLVLTPLGRENVLLRYVSAVRVLGDRVDDGTIALSPS